MFCPAHRNSLPTAAGPPGCPEFSPISSLNHLAILYSIHPRCNRCQISPTHPGLAHSHLNHPAGDAQSSIHDPRFKTQGPRFAIRTTIPYPQSTTLDQRSPNHRTAPGTSEFTARSLRHAGIPNITILAPAVPPGSPEFTPDRRGVTRMPGIQPDPKPKSPSTSAFDRISMQPLPNSLNTPGFGPLTPKSSRRRNEQPSEKGFPSIGEGVHQDTKETKDGRD